MWPQVEERLRKIGAGREYILHRDIKTFGAGESQVESMLPDLIRRGNDPLVGINASKNTIILRISTKGPTREACEEKIKPIVDTIHRCLGDLVFGYDEEELQDVVLAGLAQRGKTLAIVEADTAGMVADWLYQAEQGKKNVFRGGIVLASETLVDRIVSGPSVGSGQPLSDAPGELAALLAHHVRNLFGADIGLAATAMRPKSRRRSWRQRGPRPKRKRNSRSLPVAARGGLVAWRRFRGAELFCSAPLFFCRGRSRCARRG